MDIDPSLPIKTQLTATQPSTPLFIAANSPEELTTAITTARESLRDAQGFTDTFESLDSPVKVDISTRITANNYVTYDAQGRANDPNASRGTSPNVKSFEMNYTQVRESLQRDLALTIRTNEGDLVQINSGIRSRLDQRTLDNPNYAPENSRIGALYSQGSSGSAGNSFNITGDLNEEEKAEVNQVLSSTLRVVDLSEKFSKGEVSEDEVRSAISDLSELKKSLKSIKTFSGSIEVEKSQDVIHGVERFAVSSTRVGKKNSAETETDTKPDKELEKVPTLGNFLERIIDIISTNALKDLESKDKKDQREEGVNQLRDANINSFRSHYAYSAKSLAAGSNSTGQSFLA